MEAAKRVFDKRNLSREQISTIKQELKQKQDEDEIMANEPLDRRYKILAFIFPKIVYFFPGAFEDERYERKNNELTRWQFYGMAFYAGIIVVIMILELGFKL